MPYFVNLSTITRILSNPLDKGNSRIKSIDTTSKGGKEWEWVVIIQQEHDASVWLSDKYHR